MFEPQKLQGQDIILPREVTSSPEFYDDGFLRVEHCCYYVACGGNYIKLGRCEFLIVSVLTKNADRFVSFETIWNHVWEGKREFNHESLKVFIYNLRRQFEPFGIKIETMVKFGYKLTPSNKS